MNAFLNVIGLLCIILCAYKIEPDIFVIFGNILDLQNKYKVK